MKKRKTQPGVTFQIPGRDYNGRPKVFNVENTVLWLTGKEKVI